MSEKSTHQAPSRPPAMRPPTSARTDNIRGIPGGNMFHQNLFLICSSLSHQSSQTGDRKADPQMFLRQNFHNLDELRNLLDQDQVWESETYCGEDGEGEEAGLDVVPVERELLRHQVHPRSYSLTAHLVLKNIFLLQGFIHVNQIDIPLHTRTGIRPACWCNQ